MEYRTLGNSGAVVSTYALGTMTFGIETSEEGAHEQLERRQSGERLRGHAMAFTRLLVPGEPASYDRRCFGLHGVFRG